MLKSQKLGRQGLTVPELGLGCMGMSWAYGPADEKESLRVLHRSLELGCNFWDSAESYGPYKNEDLLGRALDGRPRDGVVLATKFAWEFGPNGERGELNSSPAHIKKSVEGSLKRLRTDYIDLYYQHRLDPKTPIEDTVGALAELVREGKVRHLGLSEVSASTIRRAHAVHPIAAIQTEYSLWERGVENEILPTLKELGIGFVPYSPMGRGFLTGRFEKPTDFPAGDRRRDASRFEEGNFELNFELVRDVRALAAEAHATPAQVALAWLLRQQTKTGVAIVPIPGTKQLKYLEENLKAAELSLTDHQWMRLEACLAKFKTAGERYPESAMKTIDTSKT